MATVQGMTLARALALEAVTVVDGYINGSGHLILVHHDGSETDAGDASVSVADASTTQAGKVELATSAETLAGTDTLRVVTPAGLEARFSDNFAGPVDVGTPATRDIMQWDGTKWINTTNVDLNGYVRATRATAANGSFAAAVTGDTIDRLTIFSDGKMSWGPGGSSGQDTTLYRSTANTLKTDDTFVSALGLSVLAGGAAITGNSTVTGDLNVTGNLTGAGKPVDIAYFTASNLSVAKLAGAKKIRFRCWGGGASGSGAQTGSAGQSAHGSGGQAGGYSEKIVDASTIPSTYAIVIGAGGATTSGGAAGNDGTDTTVNGTTVVAKGGKGSPSAGASSAVFGSNQTPSTTLGTGNIAVPGMPGGYGFGGPAFGVGGTGGSSLVGSGGVGGYLAAGSNTSTPGLPGNGYASGGGGGLTIGTGSAAAGGAGMSGLCIVETYF